MIIITLIIMNRITITIIIIMIAKMVIINKTVMIIEIWITVLKFDESRARSNI